MPSLPCLRGAVLWVSPLPSTTRPSHGSVTRIPSVSVRPTSLSVSPQKQQKSFISSTTARPVRALAKIPRVEMWTFSSFQTSKGSLRCVKLLFYARRSRRQNIAQLGCTESLFSKMKIKPLFLWKTQARLLGGNPIHSNCLFVDYLLWKAWLKCLYCLSLFASGRWKSMKPL